LLTGCHVDDSVSAQRSAEGRAGDVITGVAFLSVVNDSVAARGETARGTAAVGQGGVHWSVVALFTGIDHVITATGVTAVTTARVGTAVGVTGTLVTFLSGLEHAVAHGARAGLGDVKIELGKEVGLDVTTVEHQRDGDPGAVHG